MKRAKVFNNDVLCGYLIQDDDGYTFRYLDEYLMRNDCRPISLTLPLNHKEYHSSFLFPFFDGLIPEGWLLYLTLKSYNLDSRNRFDILLKTGKDTMGSVTIEEDI